LQLRDVPRETLQMASARYFGDFYDSASQARNHRRGDEMLARLFKGRLRADAFINRMVVVKDGDLFDGMFFLDRAARSLMDELPLDRVQFALRAANLQESILLALVPQSAEFLKPLFFDSLPHSAAMSIMNQLRRYPAKKVRSWKQLPKLFRSFGAPADEIERLEAGWSALIELDRQQKLLKQQWPTGFDFGGELRRLLDGRHADLVVVLNTAKGRDVADDLLKRPTSLRTEVISRLAMARETDSNPSFHVDTTTIESWYVAAYIQTAAIHNGCDVVHISDVPGSAAFRESQRLFDKILSSPGSVLHQTDISYPDDFVEALGIMDSREFSEVLNEQRANLQLWYDFADANGLRRAIDALVEKLEKKYGLKDKLLPEPFSFGLTLVASGLGAGLATLTPRKFTRRDVVKSAAVRAAVGAMAGGIIVKSIEKAADSIASAKTIARSIVERAVAVRSASVNL
jgi:hypothetical protein